MSEKNLTLRYLSKNLQNPLINDVQTYNLWYSCYTFLMSSFIIRPATENDAHGIATVHVKTWQCAYRGQIPDSYLDSLKISQREKMWSEMLSDPKEGMYTQIAEMNGKIVGWCTFGNSRDQDVDKTTAELAGIYVDPEYMGQGVGSSLMQEAIETMAKKGYEKITLWVLHSNKITREFYEKKGWVMEGRTKDDQRDGFILHEVRYILSLGEIEKK